LLADARAHANQVSRNNCLASFQQYWNVAVMTRKTRSKRIFRGCASVVVMPPPARANMRLQRTIKADVMKMPDSAVSRVALAHVLFGEPVSTFPGHALCRHRLGFGRLRQRDGQSLAVERLGQEAVHPGG